MGIKNFLEDLGAAFQIALAWPDVSTEDVETTSSPSKMMNEGHEAPRAGYEGLHQWLTEEPPKPGQPL